MPSGACQVRSRPFTSLEARACQAAGVGFLSLISKISVRGGRGPSNLSAHVTPDLIRGPPSLACLPNGRWMQDQVRHDEWLQCASFGVSINSTRTPPISLGCTTMTGVDRKSVVSGKSVSVSGDLGGRRL